MFAKPLAAAATALIISAAGFASPAMAAGQISLSFSPTDPDQQQALGMGLRLFSVVQGLSATGANGIQNGNFNAAGFSQNGNNNHGLIIQDGNGHQGNISQNGNNNSCGLFQFGQNTNAQCAQYGNGQSGIPTVFGF